MFFATATELFDFNIDKYSDVVIKNRENGKKHIGKTKESQNNPVGFSETQNNLKEKERVKEKGKDIKELKSSHKIIRKISTNYSIYCSPGHFIDFSSEIKNKEKLKKFLFNHQIKKKFQFSLEWENDQLAIWDNRSMLHQATPFKGNRIMHRITIE